MISRAGLSVTGWQRKGCKLDVKYHGFQCLWKTEPNIKRTSLLKQSVKYLM